MAEKKNWIAGAIKKPGSLRKELGAKEGKPIPVSYTHLTLPTILRV